MRGDREPLPKSAPLNSAEGCSCPRVDVSGVSRLFYLVFAQTASREVHPGHAEISATRRFSSGWIVRCVALPSCRIPGWADKGVV